MLGKLILGGGIALGVLLIVIGVQRVLDRRAAERVAEAFMTALIEGDRATLLSLLPPESRAALEHDDADEHQLEWVSEPGVRCRIHHVQVQGAQAEARLWIEKNGFTLKPLLRLRRSGTRVWKISGVDDLQVDKRWNDLQRERGRIDGEQLARELTDALGHLPNVRVERISFADQNAQARE